MSTAITTRPCGQNHVFLDLGANDGQSLVWFHKHIMPQAAQRPYTSTVAFEMNALFTPALDKVLKQLRASGLGTTLELGAVWTADGVMTANMQQPGSRTASKGGVTYNMTSSALEVNGLPLNKQARQRARRPPDPRFERSMSVRTIDVASWLKRHFCSADMVDVKMDIEGAEFEVPVLDIVCALHAVGLASQLCKRACLYPFLRSSSTFSALAVLDSSTRSSSSGTQASAAQVARGLRCRHGGR